jgi:broad-specificity NMP kinase
MVELGAVSVSSDRLTMILGLTGGFGCGKSTAAKLFAEWGFRHVDSDLIVQGAGCFPRNR